MHVDYDQQEQLTAQIIRNPRTPVPTDLRGAVYNRVGEVAVISTMGSGMTVAGEHFTSADLEAIVDAQDVLSAQMTEALFRNFTNYVAIRASGKYPVIVSVTTRQVRAELEKMLVEKPGEPLERYIQNQLDVSKPLDQDATITPSDEGMRQWDGDNTAWRLQIQKNQLFGGPK